MLTEGARRCPIHGHVRVPGIDLINPQETKGTAADGTTTSLWRSLPGICKGVIFKSSMGSASTVVRILLW